VGVGATFYTVVALAEFLIEGRLRDILGRRASSSRWKADARRRREPP